MTATQRNWAVAVAIGFCLSGLLFAVFQKGIWIDEAFTQFASRHDLPIGDLWRIVWLTDVHPAGHYLFAWLLEPITGQNIHAERLTNLIPLAFATVGLFVIA